MSPFESTVKWAASIEGLGRTEKAVLIGIAIALDGSTSGRPRQTDVAAMLGLSDRAVRGAMAHLVSAGLIAVEQVGPGAATVSLRPDAGRNAVPTSDNLGRNALPTRPERASDQDRNALPTKAPAGDADSIVLKEHPSGVQASARVADTVPTNRAPTAADEGHSKPSTAVRDILASTDEAELAAYARVTAIVSDVTRPGSRMGVHPFAGPSPAVLHAINTLVNTFGVHEVEAVASQVRNDGRMLDAPIPYLRKILERQAADGAAQSALAQTVRTAREYESAQPGYVSPNRVPIEGIRNGDAAACRALFDDLERTIGALDGKRRTA